MDTAGLVPKSRRLRASAARSKRPATRPATGTRMRACRARFRRPSAPQFAKMLSQIRDGETLVVTKLDRLGRDAQDIGATIKALAARRIEVIVLQLGKLDLTSAAGKLMLNMLAAVAEMERDLLVVRTQSGLARAKAEGETLGRPSSTTEEQRAVMARQHQAGKSISALARTFGISRASVMRVVKPTATIQ